MTDLTIGSSAPDFELETDGGASVKLSALIGTPVVVYFYPKDNTPGCTKQAIGFSEKLADFEKLGVKIIGISPDSVAKHDNFKAKHNLTITLAADPDKKACEAYGVWVEKSMYGKKYMGVDRSTFLIDSSGKIVQTWRKVKVPGHIETVLEAAKAL
ncbi:MAG: thioredoxin-dependent thiol peroxidase [Rhodobacteraceae bacterium]|nr:thioredoxin-dependent thiol peroxidase [Paracoccaceae bacterium]